MMLTLGLSADAASQSHRHTPRTEQVDSTQNNHDAIEAFSDTTGVDSADVVTYQRHRNISDEDVQVIKGVLEGVGEEEMAWAIVAIVGIIVMFLLAPLLIIIAILYFVNKNRKEKYKLAQMAIQNGQPVPDNILQETKTGNVEKDDYTSGIRQLFLGIGLMFFLGYAAGKIGVGIGALVFFIGLGKVIIAKTSGNKKNDDINNQSLQNYD